jgi:hypothetical protein
MITDAGWRTGRPGPCALAGPSFYSLLRSGTEKRFVEVLLDRSFAMIETVRLVWVTGMVAVPTRTPE